MAAIGDGGGAVERARMRAWNTVRENWYLGFTSFGGPPVHFKIFHDKFTSKLGWIDEQVVRALSAVCQALSGPGSTKMHYCINLIHDGFPSAVLGFLNWSLPGALAMYGLSVGVSNISETLPRAAYALLSGLNAATVGIIALAAVFLGAAAGMLYNALWYFPLLMLLAGLAAVVHDYRWERERVDMVERGVPVGEAPQRGSRDDQRPPTPPPETQDEERTASAADEPRVIPPERRFNMSWKLGLGLILAFLASFIVVMILRGVLPQKPLLYRLFANMYLAGTIIFGAGLLSFRCCVNMWSRRVGLTASGAGLSSVAGAVLGYLGIFVPGMWLVHGTMGIWSALRGRPWVKSILRGVNAGAVGLVYTAVYRLWQIGYIDKGYQDGTSLGVEPWWVVVTATSYVGGMWFGVKPAVAIIMGAVMGLIWYGVVVT
ncbi:chromate transporter-domain-containing protein [Diaporthe sp. PMI_573]|nr:chromate transporter-domain-containing protein [Diaporthaceae sp. PMI_573]